MKKSVPTRLKEVLKSHLRQHHSQIAYQALKYTKLNSKWKPGIILKMISKKLFRHFIAPDLRMPELNT